mgnify:CR=1 FL=1
MLEIKKVINEKYNTKDINYYSINDLEMLEFNFNLYVDIKILKFKEHYNLLITILNSDLFPTKNITINLEYKTYDKLLKDLEDLHFRFL